MRVFPLILLLSLFSMSCDKGNGSGDSDSSLPECSPFIISQTIFQELDPSQATLEEVTLDVDCLRVKISVSGCDANHTISMITDGTLNESLPPQITFDFRDNDLQDCEAYITVEADIDLSELRDLNDGDILIRFRNSDKSILYEK